MKFKREIEIDHFIISDHSPAYIIAEAGVNHNGDRAMAERLIDAAAEAGVNAVKFQSFKPEQLVLRNASNAPYQKKTTACEESQFQMLKALEMGIQEMKLLQEYAKKKGLTFLSTPFEKESMLELCKMGVPAFKIAATDLTNIQFLRQIAKAGKPMILSAGMCYLEEVYKALEAIYEYNDQVILLQCSANYPIQDNEANLRVIDTLKEEFDILVGYSDHSVGIGASPYAAVKGARVIEKHFTLDKELAGPDQRASVTPKELAQLVREVRRAEQYLGNGIKMPTCSEQFTRKSLQKYLVVKKSIPCGEPFTDDNIVAKRTDGKGISAIYVDDVLNTTAKRDYEPDDIIEY